MTASRSTINSGMKSVNSRFKTIQKPSRNKDNNRFKYNNSTMDRRSKFARINDVNVHRKAFSPSPKIHSEMSNIEKCKETKVNIPQGFQNFSTVKSIISMFDKLVSVKAKPNLRFNIKKSLMLKKPKDPAKGLPNIKMKSKIKQ